MSNKDIEWFDLFDPFSRSSLGFDRLFGDLVNIRNYQTEFEKFPPHNIRRKGVDADNKNVADEYFIDLALAGFNKEDLEITVGDNILTIQGSEDAEKTVESSEFEYLHRGIAKRHFTKQFKLGPGVKVLGAKMEAGTLTVHLRQPTAYDDIIIKVEIE